MNYPYIHADIFLNEEAVRFVMEAFGLTKEQLDKKYTEWVFSEEEQKRFWEAFEKTEG